MNKFQTNPAQILGANRRRAAIILFLGILAAVIGIAKIGNYGQNASAQTSQKEIKGEWTAEFDRAKPGEIYFNFQRRSTGGGFSMNSDNLALGELQGLTPDAVSSTKTNVNFTIVREAGTFSCEGFFSNGKGAGFWTLAPSDKFISALRSRGYDNLSADDLTRAALNNLTVGFIEELKTNGYDRLTFDEVMRARTHDITAEYIRQVKAMGFTGQPLETIIRMRNHDITPEFVNEMKSAGFENLSIEELIRLQNHEITLAFINDLKAEGYPDVAPEAAIRLKNHDIDRDFIRRAKAQGYTNASVEELIRLRNREIVK
jgi:uncharacterized protein (UPF0335 family)